MYTSLFQNNKCPLCPKKPLKKKKKNKQKENNFNFETVPWKKWFGWRLRMEIKINHME